MEIEAGRPGHAVGWVSGAETSMVGNLARRIGGFNYRATLSLVVLAILAGSILYGFGASKDQREEEFSSSTMAASILSFTATPNTVYVGEEVTFTATASSSSSTDLKFTIYYDAVILPYENNTHSPFSIHYATESPATIVAKYTYDHVGNFSLGGDTYFIVRLVVSDGSATVDTELINVFVLENTAPVFESSLPGTLPTLDPGEELDLSIKVRDADADPLTVTWDYGDGSFAVNETGPALPGVYVNQTHAWNPITGPGIGGTQYYTVVITLEDPYSNVRISTSTVGVVLPPNGVPTITFTVNRTVIDPMDEVAFNASATDPEGEALTWTYEFNNSVEIVDTMVFHTDTTPPGTKVWTNFTYVFESPGSYSIRLYVCDGVVPYQHLAHNVSRLTTLRVLGNSAPSVVAEIMMSNETPMIDVAVGYCSITFTVQVYDTDGDIVTATWDMDDGEELLVNTSYGGLVIYTFKQTHFFNETGVFNISVSVTDNLPEHEVLRYRLVQVSSNNMPPSVQRIDYTLENGNFAVPDEVIQFILVFADPECDALEVRCDFGDNSSIESYNLTEYQNGTTTCVVNHSYSVVGDYSITITYTDNVIGLLTHNKTKILEITVDTVYIRTVEVWNWWDYTALGILLAIPVAIVVNLLRTRRRRALLESQGVSLEEMKLVKSEQIDEPDDRLEVEVD